MHDATHLTGTIGVVADAGEANFDARFDNFVLYDGSCSPAARMTGSITAGGDAGAAQQHELVSPFVGDGWASAGAAQP